MNARAASANRETMPVNSERRPGIGPRIPHVMGSSSHVAARGVRMHGRRGDSMSDTIKDVLTALVLYHVGLLCLRGAAKLLLRHLRRLP